MSIGELAEARSALLGFVQDLRIRVSVFLKEKQQTPNGTFILPTGGPVPYGSEMPGIIRVFESRGELAREVRFPCGGQYTAALPHGSLASTGPRGTSLGTNIYATHTDEQSSMINHNVSGNDPGLGYTCQQHTPISPAYSDDNSPVSGRAKDELNLLAQLIGSVSSSKKEFKLNLFYVDDDSIEEDVSLANDVITIEGKKRGGRPELGKILGEMTLQDEEPLSDQDQDLLDLMDSVKS
nr:protein OSCP1-like [Cherax quadricarinatus]